MTKKSQQIKFKKAPGAPKRFKSAYMFFSENQHKVIRQNCTNKKIRAAEVAKLVSQAWKDLSDEGRSKWLELGRLDRQRYDREKAVYKGPWKVPDVKDPKAPKRPMSAFLSFSNERRKSLVEEYPDMSGTEISRTLSKMWRECPVDIKQVYHDKETHAREQYRLARAAWELQKNQTFSGVAVIDDSSSRSSGITDIDESVSDQDPASSCASIQDDPLDVVDLSDMLAYSEVVSREGKSFLNTLDTIRPFDLSRIDIMESSPYPSKDSFELFTNPMTFSCFDTPHKIELPPRDFENFSMDDILESDELFEDFSPSQVETTTIPFDWTMSRAETHCQSTMLSGSMADFVAL